MKTLLSVLLIITLSKVTIAQTTAIPDVNFEQALINLGYDIGVPDGSVPTANINTVTFLPITSANINDLTGIEDFTALTVLRCEGNNLTSLNITQNTALITFYCYGNQLINLDVTQNTALTDMYCSSNQLTSLDVTQNTALTELDCDRNQLTSLDVSQNIDLTELICDQNQLTSLDVSQNTSLTGFNCNDNQLICLNVKNGNNSNVQFFRAYNNPNLTCIEVDDAVYSTSQFLWWSSIDATSSFSTNCNNTCSTTGINEYSLSDFNIYPNPVLNQLTIDTELAISQVSIIDLSGRTVTTTSQQTKLADVTYLHSGIYFIKVITEENTITKKFVKQ